VQERRWPPIGLERRAPRWCSGERSDARVDAKREERRKVLALNKLGAAAQEVRRAWVRDHLLARKTPVKGSAMFMATCLDARPEYCSTTPGSRSSASCWAWETTRSVRRWPSWRPPLMAAPMCWGMVLAALEGRTPKDAWRQATATWTPTPGPADYCGSWRPTALPIYFCPTHSRGRSGPHFVPARQKAGRTGVAVELGSQPRGCNRAATTVQRRKPILLAVRAARPGAATR
jgi:hypothetical protein